MAFELDRRARVGRHALDRVFRGLEDSLSMRALFPRVAARRLFLGRCQVRVSPDDLYAYVDDGDGTVVVGQNHLRTSEERVLYLDILHELVHVKQFRDGRELFDRRYHYVDRPTELEAYALGVREARGLRMSDKEILEYLEVPWVSARDMGRLAERLGVGAGGHGP
jgi:hypothetical protein